MEGKSEHHLYLGQVPVGLGQYGLLSSRGSLRTRGLENFTDKLENLTEYNSGGHISWVC